MLSWNTSYHTTDSVTTEIYTLSLHDALPICDLDPKVNRDFLVRQILREQQRNLAFPFRQRELRRVGLPAAGQRRSEEHTSELQSQSNLVCRLLLEKKKQTT